MKNEPAISHLIFDYDKRKIRPGKKRRINDIYWWGGETTLALLIIDITNKLSQETHSNPSHLTPRKWKKILKDIGDGFKLYFKFADDWKWGRSEKKKYEKAWDLLREYFGDLWD